MLETGEKEFGVVESNRECSLRASVLNLGNYKSKALSIFRMPTFSQEGGASQNPGASFN